MAAQDQHRYVCVLCTCVCVFMLCAWMCVCVCVLCAWMCVFVCSVCVGVLMWVWIYTGVVGQDSVCIIWITVGVLETRTDRFSLQSVQDILISMSVEEVVVGVVEIGEEYKTPFPDWIHQGLLRQPWGFHIGVLSCGAHHEESVCQEALPLASFPCQRCVMSEQTQG